MLDIQEIDETKKVNIKLLKITNPGALNEVEKERNMGEYHHELFPWAIGTTYLEIADKIIPDKNYPWNAPLFYSISIHRNTVGIKEVCQKASDYIFSMESSDNYEVLSICACMDNDKIALKVLVRSYSGSFNFVGFFDYIDDTIVEDIDPVKEVVTGKLIVPDAIKNFTCTDEDIRKHKTLYKEQMKFYDNATKDKPFLNMITSYVPKNIPSPEDHTDLIYDVKTHDMSLKTIATYEHFNKIFKELMNFVNGVEYHNYIQVMIGDKTEKSFMEYLESYIKNNYISNERLSAEDFKPMMEKLHRSLFQNYIIQDLIDDPSVTDINITAPDSIRARVKGKTYLSNLEFIDEKDYLRFVNGIAVKNRILQTVPEQTFSDHSDKNYILRITLSAAYANSVPWPYIHFRKIDRRKPLDKELMAAGMFDEKIHDYLLDCGKHSRGVVFAGPPGSGKTVCLNWFLEKAYEQSADILVIQENDELFAYRKGVRFQHVVNYSNRDEEPVDLEDLGKLALVAGANVFIIGEAKGAEICSAITLSNSGCRTAITIHSPSSTETIDKMADLAMRGYARDYDQAMMMIRSFQTIVYLDHFKITEISEITGYNEETHKMEYKYIYRKEDN